MAKYKAITNLSSNPSTYKGSTVSQDFAILARNFKDLIEDYNRLKTFIEEADLAAEVDHLAGITLNDGRRKFQPKTGILIPMYISPSFIFTNDDYNTLIDLGKEYPTVPLVVILNPNSGPGTVVSADYTEAIKRLQGAGATVIGYISTAFTANTLKTVTTDVDTWLSLYPGIDGIFYDEMTNAAGADDINIIYYKALADYIHSKSLYPAIGNSGSLPNVKYYTEDTADVIVMVEQAGMPTEVTLKGDFVGGNIDFVKYDRAAIVHTKSSLLVSEIDLLSKYTSLIYITDDILANPYDTLSKYLEQLFQILTSKLWDAVSNNEVARAAFGEASVSQLSPQFQGSFESTVDNTDLNTNTIANGGTVTQANAMAVLTSSTTTASTALFESRQHARYKAGLGGLSRFTALFSSSAAATEQYIGIMDEVGSTEAFKNGYAVGYNGLTFGFHRFQDDALITVAQADWDDPMDGTGRSGMTLDSTKLNVFEIRYQYLGSGKIELCIESDQTGRFLVVHAVQYTNTSVIPSTFNPNFHHVMWVDNKATTSNLILKSSSYAYFVEGKTSLIELHQPENASGSKTLPVLAGVEGAIFTIRNRSTYASKTNFIDAQLLSFGGSIDTNSANNLATIRVVKNATLGGTPSYSNVNTNNSIMEIDTSGTTVTGGTELDSIELSGKNDRGKTRFSSDRIILNPGETITIAGISIGNATMKGNDVWRELF